MLNNIWGIIIILVLLFAIYNKIISLNKPYDEKKIISQYQNQLKLQDKINLNELIKNIPTIASYYTGIK